MPDLLTFGKVVGGGMPLAAVAGRAEVMEMLAPLGPVYQAGTLSGNPLATAAGLLTLQLANDADYATVARGSQQIGEVISQALSAEGVAHRVQRSGSLFSVMFGTEAAEHGVRDYDQARAQETFRFAPFFHAFLESSRPTSSPSPAARPSWSGLLRLRRRPPARRPRSRRRRRSSGSDPLLLHRPRAPRPTIAFAHIPWSVADRVVGGHIGGRPGLNQGRP